MLLDLYEPSIITFGSINIYLKKTLEDLKYLKVLSSKAKRVWIYFQRVFKNLKEELEANNLSVTENLNIYIFEKVSWSILS